MFTPVLPLVYCGLLCEEQLGQQERRLRRQLRAARALSPQELGVKPEFLPRPARRGWAMRAALISPQQSASGGVKGQDASAEMAAAYGACISELQRLPALETISSKLQCVLKVCTGAIEVAQNLGNSCGDGKDMKPTSLATDELLPILVFIVVWAAPPQLSAEAMLLEHCLPDHLQFGETAFCLTTLQSAIQHLLHLPTAKPAPSVAEGLGAGARPMRFTMALPPSPSLSAASAALAAAAVATALGRPAAAPPPQSPPPSPLPPPRQPPHAMAQSGWQSAFPSPMQASEPAPARLTAASARASPLSTAARECEF